MSNIHLAKISLTYKTAFRILNPRKSNFLSKTIQGPVFYRALVYLPFCAFLSVNEPGAIILPGFSFCARGLTG
jgi:hypothetical protein